MKIPDIIELIEKGEGETVEFKRSFNSETIETVVAFANSKGGFIILGIEDNGSIKVTDKVTKDVTKDVGKDVGKEISSNSRKIYFEIKENPQITIPELSSILNVTDRTVERQISKLKEIGMIKREGGRKKGYWIVQSSKK